MKPGRSDEPQVPRPVGPRWTGIPFPSYRYVPGVTPRHAHGDRYEQSGDVHRPWSPEEWGTLERYLYGIDLYNNGFFWESHEALEDLWKSAERGSIQGRFVQGIIQIAAANLHRHMGRRASSLRQAEKGLTNLGAALGEGPVYMGISIAEFSNRVRAYLSGKASKPPAIELIFGDGKTPTGSVP